MWSKLVFVSRSSACLSPPLCVTVWRGEMIMLWWLTLCVWTIMSDTKDAHYVSGRTDIKDTLNSSHNCVLNNWILWLHNIPPLLTQVLSHLSLQARISPRSPCRWVWTSLWVPSSGSVRSWNTASCWTRPQPVGTRLTGWYRWRALLCPHTLSLIIERGGNLSTPSWGRHTSACGRTEGSSSWQSRLVMVINNIS